MKRSLWLLALLAAIAVVLLLVPSALPTLQQQLEEWGSQAGQQEAGQQEPAASPDGWPATIEYVHDGDTLFLIQDDGTELKVRLIGIDTPEIGDHAECYGEQATSLLRELLPEGSTVTAVPDRDELDEFGRALLYLYGADGEFVNLTMIERGAAEAVAIGNNDRFADELFAAEDAARAAGLGMWGSC